MTKQLKASTVEQLVTKTQRLKIDMEKPVIFTSCENKKFLLEYFADTLRHPNREILKQISILDVPVYCPCDITIL